jgi:hypothetical protein
MRQISDEFRVNPKESIRVTAMPEPEWNETQQRDFAQWYRMKWSSHAAQFCAKSVGYDFAQAAEADWESKAMQSCMKKVHGAFQVLSQEKGIFHNELAAMKSRGEDVFAKFNQDDITQH